MQEVQPNAWGFPGDPRQEAGPEVLDEALAGPKRERPLELPEIELAGRPQGRFGVMDELADGVAKLERTGGRHQSATCAHQQGIAGGLTQSRQRSAHQALARNAADPARTGVNSRASHRNSLQQRQFGERVVLAEGA